MSEGDVNVQDILFEKYHVESVVYESDTTTVYLVEHIHMSAKRIIKKVLKESIHRNSFYSEISILKNIKHPYIPIIYDVQEDDMAYYIIEEYINGISLMKYVEEHGVLLENESIKIGVKICEIISFLHSQKPIPILFLDLQPKNILIQNEKIYLVDFGSSFYLNDASKRKLLLGTTGYAAPEQYRYEKLDERTDVYGIGAVLYFMVTGRGCAVKSTKSLEFPNIITGKYKTIVSQCMSVQKEYRIENVDIVKDKLLELSRERKIYSCDKKPLIISIVGTQSRIGTTTFSIALAMWLSEKGYKTIYEEANENNHLRAMANLYKFKYANGYFEKNNLLLKPYYGPQVQLSVEGKYVVRDVGTDLNELYESDVLLVVAGAKPWEKDYSLKAFHKYGPKAVMLANLSIEKESEALWKEVGKTGFLIPYIRDMFVLDDNLRVYFNELFLAVLKEKEGGENNKKKARLFEKFTKKSRCDNRWNNRGL